MTLRTDSDRWMAAALPAIATIVLGWFVFLGAASKEERDLRRRVESQSPVAEQRMRVAKAHEDLAALNRETDKLRAQIDDAGLKFDQGIAMRRVSALCDELHIQIGQTVMEPNSTKLPVALKTAATKFGPENGTTPQVWCIEVAGSYASVVKLLQSMATSSPMIVPLNLTMVCDPKELRFPVWNLYVWL